MTDMLSAGVYPVEVDFSPSVQAVSTSTFGLVGVFEKGPVGVPTLVTSLLQAQQTFGTYIDAQGFRGMLALKAYFENGGGRAYVVRTVHYAAGVAQGAAATATLSDRNATPANTLTVNASSPGAWGDNLSVTVSASVAFPTTGFNIDVKLSGATVESFKDLLIGAANVPLDDYVEKRVNGVSKYITVTDVVSATAAPSNRPAEATTALASGNDGTAGITGVDYVGDAGTRNGLYALDSVAVNFVAIPGEADATIAATLATGLITYVEGRADCVALIEAPKGSDRDALLAFRNGTAPWAHSAFNSTYAAFYGPGVIESHPVTGREVWIPPTAIAAGVIASNDTKGAVWTAPAGLNRGVIKGALRPEFDLSKGDRDALYVVNINPICNINGSLVIWGSRTLELKFGKLSNLHVRRTMCFIEVSVDTALNTLLFEPDNVRTMDSAVRLVNPFLRQIRDGGGLLDFKVISDSTINTPDVTSQNILKVRIFVKPVGCVEFIPVEHAITNDGTDFNEL